MFPIRLNLLSPDKQRYLHRIVYVQFAKNSLQFFLCIICLSGIMLLGAQWILEGYFNDLAESLTATARDTEKNQRINEVNNLIKNAAEIQKIYTLWTPELAAIAAAIPDGVVLSNFELDSVNRSYVLGGNARTRDDLLRLRTQLEKLPFIETVPIPLSQLTEKENVSFSISATMACDSAHPCPAYKTAK